MNELPGLLEEPSGAATRNATPRGRLVVIGQGIAIGLVLARRRTSRFR